MASTQAPGPQAAFQQHLNEGRLRLQRSKSSGAYVFPPRVAAPQSGADDLEWHEVSGYGHVYALTVVGRRPERGGDYNIVIVELDEGPRMMSRVVDADLATLSIGSRVQACVGVPDFGALKGSDQAVVFFRAVEGGGVS
jgi:uncharacterized OB-fold protein